MASAGTQQKAETLSGVSKEQWGASGLRGALGFAGTQELPLCGQSALYPSPRGEWHQGFCSCLQMQG